MLSNNKEKDDAVKMQTNDMAVFATDENTMKTGSFDTMPGSASLLPGNPQPTKGSFVIRSRSSNKIIHISQEDDIRQLLIEYPVLAGIRNLVKDKAPLLYICKQAEHEIKKHISWNQKTSDNIYEQGGILIGKPFWINNSILGVVEHSIPAELSRADSAYLEMGTGTWAKMLRIYDEQYKDEGLFVIGWYHTHPNGLPVFMSSTDMETQKKFFNQDWHFSVVLNPHRCLIVCFNSADSVKCDFYPSNFIDR